MTVFYFVLGVLAMVVGIGASIALHEIGHLLPAKKFGVKCSQYMIGFGPTIWSTRRGETEYGVKAIPLGGYVRMLGMFPPKSERKVDAKARSGRLSAMIEDARTDSLAEIGPGEEHRAFYRLSTPQKITVMLGGPLMNLLLAALVLAGVVVVNGVPAPGAQVGTVSQCVRPVTAQADTSPCTAADTPSPAAAAGIRPGDVIVSIDGERVEAPEDVASIVRPHAGEPVSMVVQRDGQPVSLNVTPIANSVPELDSLGRAVTDANGRIVTTTAGFIGTTTGRSPEQDHSITRTPGLLWDMTSRTARVVLTLPQRMVDVWNAAFGPAERDAEGPMSVVGVGRVAGEVSSGTWETRDGTVLTMDVGQRVILLWTLLAGLNIALFVFNLIPLLPLDGGHIAGATWEGIKRTFARITRRPDPGYVDVAKALPVAYVMSILLIGMSVLLIYADIVKPVRL
ncbi:M50 family metallopeptidase [Mobilicoccus caccae]|uniref:Peptidase n=1 Tax=Mobilicoccus caccae TaxID=1859295 RepID=A0ABQ6IS89_9MICO|nr:site-2 protease family protein [Mobilicoccus caccae]GMA40138.1 peptidase [Mobilicoccus caccae]